MTVVENGMQVIVVDIGNTRVKAGVVDTGRWCCNASNAFPTAQLRYRLLPAIAALTVPDRRQVAVVIAGVVDHAATAACEVLLREGFVVHCLTSTTVLPLTVRYARPDTLGVDRLANALYAVSRYHDRPVIIISAGTAVVVDYVAEGAFLGGAIMPGVRLQFESLHCETDALPLIGEPGEADTPLLPAASTEECITGGVLRGCAAAISGIVTAYEAITSASDSCIIATGGDWKRLADLVAFKGDFIPDMTLIGTALSLPYTARFRG